LTPEFLINQDKQIIYKHNGDFTYSPYSNITESSIPKYYKQSFNSKYLRYTYEYLIFIYNFTEFTM
jgi:hypothetical protein